MRVEETFAIARPPDVVFDYVTDPSNLSTWQTGNQSIEPLTDGPPGLGSRFRERTKPRVGKEFEQITEFTEFDRARRLHVHTVEGPYPVDGTWTFEPDGEGTKVHFLAEGRLTGFMKLLEPLFARVMGRQFAIYHRNLRENLERD